MVRNKILIFNNLSKIISIVSWTGILVKREVTSKFANTTSDEWEDKPRFTNSFAKF